MTADEADEARLFALVDDLEAVAAKHDVALVSLIATQHSASWHHFLPTWANVVDGAHGLNIIVHPDVTGFPDAEHAHRTMQTILGLREMASNSFKVLDLLYARAARALHIASRIWFMRPHSKSN